MPTKTIGFLGASNPMIWSKYVAAFSKKLETLGNAGADKVVVDYQWAEGDPANYTAIARKFVTDGVNAIVTSGTEPVNATFDVLHPPAPPPPPPAIPIFFASAGGPLRSTDPNFVVGTLNEQKDRGLADRRFAILNQIFRPGATIAVLGNFSLDNVSAERSHIVGVPGVQGAGHQFIVREVDVPDPTNVVNQINALAGVDLLYVCTDPTITAHQGEIIGTAINKKLPTSLRFASTSKTAD